MPTPSTGHDRGATAVEYGLLVGLIAVVALSAVALLGSRMSGAISAAGCAVGGTAGAQAADCASSPAASGESVSLAGNSARRWWSGATPWSSSDMTVSGEFTLGGATTGSRGYGIVVRGTGVTTTGAQSGYTFQVDPGAGGFVVKRWNGASESSVGSRVSFPPGFDPTVAQQVRVAVQGDTLTATVGGGRAMTWQLPPDGPTGTQYGVRTWATSTVAAAGVAVS